MLAATKYQYQPLYKPNQLILGTGRIAICTGWTPKEIIARKLQPHEYAVIGSLYSAARGINFLIRNLLHNPHVRHIVIISATKADVNSGAGECLADFFEYGFKEGASDTGRKCWVICSRIPGYIDIEIPSVVLERLRLDVFCSRLRSVEGGISTVSLLKHTANIMPAWGHPLQFPILEHNSTVLPGSLYGHRVEGRNIAETWVKLIHRVLKSGRFRPTGYGGEVRELIDITSVITDEPYEFYFPEPNYLPVDLPYVKQYIPQILEDAPYQDSTKYTYSQRLRSWFGRDQIEDAIAKLIGEIDAASAVMNLWDSGGNLGRRPDGTSDHQHSGSPCLNHIWLRVLDNELSMTATFRSHDLFSAWAANCFGLRALQQHIRDAIAARSEYNLKMAPLIVISQSSHIYEDCFAHADMVVQKHYPKIISSEQRQYNDPVGNFLVEVQDSDIVVAQTTPLGEIVQTYRDRNPLHLVWEIAAANPAIAPDHIGYLGLELASAAAAIKNSKKYIQDQAKSI